MAILPNNYDIITENSVTSYSVSLTFHKSFVSARRAVSSQYQDDYYDSEEIKTCFSAVKDTSSLPTAYEIAFDPILNIPTSDLNVRYETNHYSTYSSLTDLYPLAVRYIDENGTYFIERPPFQVQLDYKIGRASSSTKRKLKDTTIWIPWTIFVINPSKSIYFYYFSDKSLSSSSDTYVAPCLPNTYPSGSICYSSSLHTVPIDYETSSLSSQYSLAINEFFAGGWNSDLTNPWTHTINQFSHMAKLKSDQYKDIPSTYPTLYSFVFPSSDTLAPILKTSKVLRSSYDYYQKGYIYSFYSDLSASNFHYVILYMLSTLSLEQTLSLIREFIDFSYSHISGTSSFQRSYYPHGTFADIVSLVSQYTNSHYDNSDHSAIPIYNSISSFFHDFPNSNLNRQYRVIFTDLDSEFMATIDQYNRVYTNNPSQSFNYFFPQDSDKLRFINKLFALPYFHDNHHYVYSIKDNDFLLDSSSSNPSLSFKEFYKDFVFQKFSTAPDIDADSSFATQGIN